jgi:hypothetical protein
MTNPTEQLQHDIAALCEDLQHSSFIGWAINNNTLSHTDAFGGTELSVLPNDAGSIHATLKKWAVHYPPFGAAIYKHKTVFEVEAKTLPELREQLDRQLRQIA